MNKKEKIIYSLMLLLMPNIIFASDSGDGIIVYVILELIFTVAYFFGLFLPLDKYLIKNKGHSFLWLFILGKIIINILLYLILGDLAIVIGFISPFLIIPIGEKILRNKIKSDDVVVVPTPRANSVYMRPCPKCNASWPINDKFCSNCGVSIDATKGHCEHCNAEIKYLQEWIMI